MDPSSLGRCGETIGPDVGRGGALELSASFPARVARGGDLFRGTVTVANRGDAGFTGLSAAEADVYVTLGGRIVATPVDKDDVGMDLNLPPGATRQLPATGRLRHCAADGAGDGDVSPAGPGKPLEPGAYQVYAALSLTEAPGGRPLLVVGGPWPLQVA
jgi:hypothetical protein